MDQSVTKTAGLVLLGATLGGALVALITPRRDQSLSESIKAAAGNSGTKATQSMDSIEIDLDEAMETARNKFGSTKLVEEKLHDR